MDDYYRWTINHDVSNYRDYLAENYSNKISEIDLHKAATVAYLMEVAMNCTGYELAQRISDHIGNGGEPTIEAFSSTMNYTGDEAIPANRSCRGELGAWYIGTPLNHIGTFREGLRSYDKFNMTDIIVRINVLDTASRLDGGSLAHEVIPFSLIEKEIVHFRMAGVFYNPIIDFKNDQETTSL